MKKISDVWHVVLMKRIKRKWIGRSILASKSRVGEIILYDFPYTNYKGSKVRPALILADSEGIGMEIIS